jgi:hypothetical protein
MRKLDIHARTFIPQQLKTHNELPAQTILYGSFPADTNFDAYIKTFLPRPLIHKSPSKETIRAMHLPKFQPHVSSGIPVALSETDYYQHFRHVLMEESKALTENLKDYTLYNVQINFVTLPKGVGAFKIPVPSLQDFVPPTIPAILIGDAVRIRIVLPAPYQYHFDGKEYIAYIHIIDRIEVSTC